MTEAAKAVLPEISANLARLVEGVSQSVVEVRNGRGTIASGIVWRPDLVITSEESLASSGSVTLALGGPSLEAKIVGRDPSTGLALLRAENLSAPPSALVAGHAPRTGELVIAAGRREQGVTARLGIVSLSAGPWRSMRGGHIDSLLRLDLTLDRRSEGGPLIDSEGRVFGIVLRGPRRSVLAIPAATIERIGTRILENGSVRPGYLGLGLHPVRVKQQDQEAGLGLMVLGVAPGGPGEAAGLMQGDVITAWNGEAVSGLRGVFRKLGPDSVGQSVDLAILRGGQKVAAKCVIGARPEA